MQSRKMFLMLATSLVAAAPLFSQQNAGSMAGGVPAVAGIPAAARAAAESIDAEKIRAHVRFLSLDLLEGRGPGRAVRNWRLSTLRHSLRWPA